MAALLDWLYKESWGAYLAFAKAARGCLCCAQHMKKPPATNRGLRGI